MTTPTPGKRSFGQTLIAVCWSFIGLRRRRDFERDVDALRPGYVLLAALLGAAGFVSLLLMAVRLAVSQA
jgi:hypothetical protein